MTSPRLNLSSSPPMPIASWIGLRHNQPRFHALCSPGWSWVHREARSHAPPFYVLVEAVHVLARAIPQLVPAPHWDLQHPSPPRLRTAAGPNDDALRSATTGTACTRRYLFTTLMPIALAHFARISKELELGMGMGMETERCTQKVDWNLEVENEMKMEMGTAHSRISVEMEMKERAYSTDRRVWMHALPIALALALALRPILAVVERGWFWLQLQGTALLRAQVRATDIEDLYVRKERGQPFSPLKRSFLVRARLTDAVNACAHAHRDPDRTFGAGVRARVRGGFAPPPLSVRANPSLRAARRESRMCRIGRSSAARANDVPSFRWQAPRPFTFLLSLFPFYWIGSVVLVRWMFALYPDTHPPALRYPFPGIPIYTLPHLHPVPSTSTTTEATLGIMRYTFAHLVYAAMLNHRNKIVKAQR
ncbi:hypothetical protein B0H13DRAFT_2555985 [Mycena leptocephala]|nr:hypothetical protein B0H13DRAFT_2555985 [Mycena leptocephala]